VWVLVRAKPRLSSGWELESPGAASLLIKIHKY
jgi:hypothetical protein